jgi:xeroderma pigmentosum group C-complementing protein
MLPVGTVHLKQTGLVRLCKKLGFDFAYAMIGWEAHGGRSCPQLGIIFCSSFCSSFLSFFFLIYHSLSSSISEGIIVCEENVDVLMDAYKEDQIKREQEATKRKSERAIKNWRRLLKAMRVRKYMTEKYGKTGGTTTSSSSSSSTTTTTTTTRTSGKSSSGEHQHVFKETMIDEERDLYRKECECGVAFEFEKI